MITTGTKSSFENQRIVVIKSKNPVYRIMMGGFGSPLHRDGGKYKTDDGETVNITQAKRGGFSVLTNQEYIEMLQQEESDRQLEQSQIDRCIHNDMLAFAHGDLA